MLRVQQSTHSIGARQILGGGDKLLGENSKSNQKFQKKSSGSMVRRTSIGLVL